MTAIDPYSPGAAELRTQRDVLLDVCCQLRATGPFIALCEGDASAPATMHIWATQRAEAKETAQGEEPEYDSDFLKLLQLHKDRLGEIFKYVNDDSTAHDEDEYSMSAWEFDRALMLVHLTSEVAGQPELLKEAYRLQVIRDFSELDDAMQSRQDGGYENDRMGLLTTRTIMQEQHDKMEEELKEMVLDAHITELKANMLLVSSGDVEWGLYMSSWLNVAAVALYRTQVDETLLDVALLFFPLINFGEIAIRVGTSSFHSFWESHTDPSRQVIHRVLFWITLVNAIFAIPHINCIIEGEQSFMHKSIPRFFLSTAGILVLTRTESLASMVHTFTIAANISQALICTVGLLMCFFAVIAKELYGSEKYGVEEYSQYRTALFSAFEIFQGEWVELMYAASDATQRETTKLPFIAYCAVVTFFFCNLFVGVLLSTFQEVQDVATHVIEGKQVPATRLYGALDMLYRYFKEGEREQVGRHYSTHPPTELTLSCPCMCGCVL